MTKNPTARRAMAFFLGGAAAACLWLLGAEGLQAQTTSTTSGATTTTTTAPATTTTTTTPATTTTTIAGTTTTTLLDCGPIDRVVLPSGDVICAHPEDPGTASPAAAVVARVAFTG